MKNVVEAIEKARSALRVVYGRDTHRSFLKEAEVYQISDALASLEEVQKAGLSSEPVAWLHQCRKRPELRELSFSQHRPDLAAKGYQAYPLSMRLKT